MHRTISAMGGPELAKSVAAQEPELFSERRKHEHIKSHTKTRVKHNNTTTDANKTCA